MSEAPRRRGRPPKGMENKRVVNEESGLMAGLVVDEPDRGSLRPPMREEDPRAAAARRAAEIRENRPAHDDGVDEFRLPPAPPGWTYEWKTKFIYGQEQASHITELRRAGWEEVPTSRHPEEMPLNGGHPVIERKGMILMQRPTVIVEEERAKQLQKARNQVRFKEAQLGASPDGHFERDRPSIKKGYSPMEIPKD